MFGILALFSAGSESFWEKIAAWYEKSLINELLTYFRDRYFTVEFGAYENFTVNSGMGETMRNIIIAIAFGLIAAFIMTAYFRIGLGKFVRKLLKEECFSPESAKTLMELGFFQSTIIRRDLTRGGSLHMVVRQCEETDAATDDTASETSVEETSAEESTEEKASDGAKREEAAKKIDFLTARFYVPEDLRARAEIRFEKKGSGWGAVIIGAILTVIGAGLLCWLLPDVVRLADNLISFFAP